MKHLHLIIISLLPFISISIQNPGICDEYGPEFYDICVRAKCYLRENEEFDACYGPCRKFQCQRPCHISSAQCASGCVCKTGFCSDRRTGKCIPEGRIIKIKPDFEDFGMPDPVKPGEMYFG